MGQKVSRRSVIKGAAGAAAAAAVAVGSKRSTVFAAPAVVQQTGSQVKISYWSSFSGNLGQAQDEVVKKFNASQQDVVVENKYQGSYEDTAQKLTAALAAKQTPEVTLLSDVWWFKFYLNKVLLPMDDLIKSNNVDASDYVDSLWNEGVRNGQQYWVPFARSTPLFYFNADMFKEIGQEGPPKTWSDFASFAPKLVKKDGGKVTQYAFSYNTGASYAAWVFMPVDWSFGGHYSTPDLKITIAEPNSVKAGDYMRQSVVDGWGMTPKDNELDLMNGIAAATLASTGSLAKISDAAKGKFNLQTAFIPEEVQFGCCTGGSGLAIMASDSKEKQEAAFKYIAFATSPEITTYWSQTTGYMPVRKSAVSSKAMQDFFAQNPNFKTAVDQLPKTQPQDSARVFIPNGDQIIGKGLERITVNKDQAQDVFNDLTKTLTTDAQPIIEKIKALQGS